MSDTPLCDKIASALALAPGHTFQDRDAWEKTARQLERELTALRASPPEAEQPERVGFIESGHQPIARVISRDSLDAALKDAARYRWLQSQTCGNAKSKSADEDCYLQLNSRDMDAAIDSARARNPKAAWPFPDRSLQP